jgi:hypothetical protein
MYSARFSCVCDFENGPAWSSKTTREYESIERLKEDLLIEATSGYTKDMCEIVILKKIESLEPNELPGYQERINEITEKKRNQEALRGAAIIEERRKLYESLKKEFEN